MSRRIAVTGGIAEGKSTVLGYCRDAGIETCSADDIARNVFKRDDVQAQIGRLLRRQAPVDPDAVRHAIAENTETRRELNRITHPEIVREMRTHRAPIMEVPLLIEACMQGEFDRVWVVTCGAEEQIRRLSARVGRLNAMQLISMQLPTAVKIAFADAIIRTNEDESRVQEIVLAQVGIELGEVL